MNSGRPAGTFRSVSAGVLVGQVREQLGLSVVADDWRPPVQGAVGHVVGLRDQHGAAYVAKLFPTDAERRAATEVTALRLLAPVTGVPVPGVEGSGELPDGGGSYVLMTRLDGVRWADRRDALGAEQRSDLLHDIAGLLRRVHGLEGDRFGSLIDPTSGSPTVWARVRTRCDGVLRDYRRHGGSAGSAGRVRRFVSAQREAFPDQVRPAFCHHDLGGGNVLVAAGGAPDIVGLVDLEGASWDDPLADLALTTAHVRWHDPDSVTALVDAYGVQSDAERRRLTVYQLLLAISEWAWLAYDRPAGWRGSAAVLDAQVQRTV